MVDDLLFCTTLTDRIGDHTPFVHARAETSSIAAEAVNPDPRCSQKGHSKRVGAGVGDERGWVPVSGIHPKRNTSDVVVR